MDRDRLKILAVFVSVFLILCGYFYFTQRNTMINKVAKIQTQSSSSDISQNHPELESAEKIIDGLKVMTSTVHVAGAVKNPGVYNLPSSSRVIDAIEKAAYEMDICRPIWLDSNISDFKRYSKVRFTKDSFIEEVPFDYLEFLVLEED